MLRSRPDRSPISSPRCARPIRTRFFFVIRSSATAGDSTCPNRSRWRSADRLFATADIVTPNRFEFAWLTGTGGERNEDIVSAAARLAARQVLVTSAHSLLAGGTGNLLIGDGRAMLAEHRQIDNPPNGTGDLTAALYLAHLLEGATPKKALQLATASVYELVARACKRGADELMPEADQASLKQPMAMVQMRQLTAAMRPRRG